MNKFTFILVALIFSLCGCQNVNEKAVIHCVALDTALDCFYEDLEYKYCFSDTGNYVTYKDKGYSVKDALEKSLITIADIEKASNLDAQCDYAKIEK